MPPPLWRARGNSRRGEDASQALDASRALNASPTPPHGLAMHKQSSEIQAQLSVIDRALSKLSLSMEECTAWKAIQQHASPSGHVPTPNNDVQKLQQIHEEILAFSSTVAKMGDAQQRSWAQVAAPPRHPSLQPPIAQLGSYS